MLGQGTREIWMRWMDVPVKDLVDHRDDAGLVLATILGPSQKGSMKIRYVDLLAFHLGQDAASLGR